MRRINKLPLIIGGGFGLVFFAILFYGLHSRGLSASSTASQDTRPSAPATNYAEQMKRGVKDAIIGEPEQPAIVLARHDEPAKPDKATSAVAATQPYDDRSERQETEAQWQARIKREQDEQVVRERQRRKMASLQAEGEALGSPLKIDISAPKQDHADQSDSARSTPLQSSSTNAADLYSAALKGGLGGGATDSNGQSAKQDFFNQDIADLGYLPNRVTGQLSALELKRGSIIPATLITGINSDLPGRISAQVSQNVYDSATGHSLLIPQGSKLLGRYDSKVSFGQSRVLVVWTDLIFPNGSTLQIGGMAGTDAAGYGGFKDQVNNHMFRTFGSAALIALIGTGIDLAIPQGTSNGSGTSPADTARQNFAETFGKVAEETISKGLNVQPTLEIRPGYTFNVLVDQDIVFEARYR